MRIQVAQSLVRSELFSCVDNSTTSIRVEGKNSAIHTTGRRIPEYSNFRIDWRENHKCHFIHVIRLSNIHLSSSLFLALSRSFVSGSSVTLCCPYNTLAFRSWLPPSLSFLQEIHQSMAWCSLKRILPAINPLTRPLTISRRGVHSSPCENLAGIYYVSTEFQDAWKFRGNQIYTYIYKGKCKVFPLQAWCGLEDG